MLILGMIRIVEVNEERIVEDCLGLFERYSVLREIGFCFLFIPFETHSTFVLPVSPNNTATTSARQRTDTDASLRRSLPAQEKLGEPSSCVDCPTPRPGLCHHPARCPDVRGPSRDKCLPSRGRRPLAVRAPHARLHHSSVQSDSDRHW